MSLTNFYDAAPRRRCLSATERMQRPTNGLPKPRDRSTEVAGETLAAPQFIELARSIVRGALHRHSLLPHSAGGLRSLSISISIGGCSEKLDANSSYATNN